jgi:hypothetical protein
MCAAGDTSDRFAYDAIDQLRHNLKTPLTTNSAGAYLLARSVRRSSSFSDGERARMLDGMAAIETAVGTMSAVIDAMGATGAGSKP